MSKRRRTGRDRQSDAYTKRARQEGHVARSVYKLEEIDQRFALLRSGNVVLDLGCAPGSWFEYAARIVGNSGRVVGVDLKPAVATCPPNCQTIVADVFELAGQAAGASSPIGDSSFDVVLSDMAPSTTGQRDTDSARSAGLCEAALEIAKHHLKPSGHAVFKLLEGRDIDSLVRQMREVFVTCSRLRPKATRKQSTEIFLIGKTKRPKNSQ